MGEFLASNPAVPETVVVGYDANLLRHSTISELLEKIPVKEFSPVKNSIYGLYDPTIFNSLNIVPETKFSSILSELMVILVILGSKLLKYDNVSKLGSRTFRKKSFAIVSKLFEHSTLILYVPRSQ